MFSRTTHYTVHLPPEKEGVDGALRAVFIKDGMNWPALLIPFLWLLYRRMWLPLLLYLVASGAIAVLGFRFGEAAAQWCGLLFAILFALEANNLRRWSLSRRGWREAGAASGRSEDEAAIRFFGGREDEFAAPAPTTASRPVVPEVAPARPRGRPWSAAGDRDTPEVMGLFPERGG
ncbi:DUF2628 domain-containing protein [Afifella aestuarii]|uniref:DUF2628 domain-containing protein n=1 Tax=Afifella aestuarii TaxID=1909496 RepID=UPI000FE3F5AC|nr:DUF2628 domain-containing protein [Afifella aestuarii]